jgi:hypothetical protein
MLMQQTIKKEKKTYQKPEIKAIDLVAEEVLSVGCKTQTHAGAGRSPITCKLSPCSGIGS